MKIICIKTRYSIEPRDKIYVKGYGFSFFAKNTGKNFSNKYGQKLCNKIADKITSISKKKSLTNDETEEDVETTTHKKDTCLQKKDNKLLMN